MFQNILIPLDGSEYSNIALKYGIYIAKKYDAKLRLLHIIDIKALEGPFFRDISASFGASPYVNYTKNIRLILEEKGKTILSEAVKECNEADVRYSIILDEGIISNKISELGEVHDLIIMGNRGLNAKWGQKIFGSVFEAVIRQSNRPILVTNNKFVEINKIMLAYDGKKFSSDALIATANITNYFKNQLIVVIVGRNNERIEELKNQVAEYLSGYKLEAKFVITKGNMVKSIINECQQTECNLIVTAAYREKRIMELVLGSKTEAIIRLSHSPVLLIR